MDGNNINLKKVSWFQWLEIAGSAAAVIGIIIAVLDYRRKVASDDLANEKAELEKQYLLLQIDEIQKKAA